MTADQSPLSPHWARRQVPDTRPRAAYADLADQLAAELDRVAAGELSAKLVLCRYSDRQLLGAAVHYGLLSERTKQLNDARQAAWVER